MIYLYWYLGIGLATLGIGATAAAAMSIAKHLKKGNERQPGRSSPETALSDTPKPPRDFYETLGIPALIILLAITAWPILIYLVGHTIFWCIRLRNNPTDEERKFSVRRQHLQEQLTLQEIEKREMVIDPLKAVPDLPFGHMNAAWITFLSKHRNDSELWSFSARWKSAWGRNELRAGYVEVHKGTPGIYFLTVWKNLPDDEKADNNTKHASPDTDPLFRWLNKYPAD